MMVAREVTNPPASPNLDGVRQAYFHLMHGHQDEIVSLGDLRDQIWQELPGSSPYSRDDTVDWVGLSQHLLESAGTQGPSAESDLGLAFATILCSDNDDDRLGFVRQVYARGLARNLAGHITGQRPILLAIGRDTKAYVPVFELPRELVEFYSRYTAEAAGEAAEDLPGTREIREQLCRVYLAGQTPSDELLAMAQAKSRAKPSKRGPLIDPDKIERYVLQEIFIGDQMSAMLGSGELEASPLATKLQAQRSRHTSTSDISITTNEIAEVFADLSKPVIDLYSVDASQEATEPTARQKIAMRFRQLDNRYQDFTHLAKFVTGEPSFSTSLVEKPELWTTARSGAGLPDEAVDLIGQTIDQARDRLSSDGELLTPKALHHLAQSRRRSLLTLIHMNVNDFSRSGVEPRRKDIAPTHRGATLGCVAARAALSGEPQRHEGIVAIHNFVDAALEIVIHEAYERGVFDLSKYTSSTPPTWW